MNWSRGFERVWMFITALWLILVVLCSVYIYNQDQQAAVYFGISSIEIPTSLTRDQAWQEVLEYKKLHPENGFDMEADSCSDPSISMTQEDCYLLGYRQFNAVTFFEWVVFSAFLPPLILLILGATVGWIFSGFKRRVR